MMHTPPPFPYHAIVRSPRHRHAPTKVDVLPVALIITLCCLNACAGLAKPVVQAVQEMDASSPSDSQGFVWMCVCIGLLVLVASTLIVATITYSYRKKKPDSGNEIPRVANKADTTDNGADN